jgi:hypothetical protein
MAILSKVDICNLALGHLGNYGSINNIDTPVTQKETTFALWYDISRQMVLKSSMPNFALARRIVAETSISIPFGYSNAYEYPSDCLRVLGFGDVDEKLDYDYTIEGGYIYTDGDWDDGLELRFIRDVEDVSAFSPEFTLLLSYQLAANVALSITQDVNKKLAMESLVLSKMSEASGLNSMENRPIKISRSMFKEARWGRRTRWMVKK